MNRRDFLRVLGFGTVAAAAASCAFDVERLLWVPGERTIFLPPVRNTFITPTWVSKEVARMFLNDLKFVSEINRYYDNAYTLRAGTVNVRLPSRFA